MSDLNSYKCFSSDALGTLLTHIKLMADNYDRWLLSFLGSLRVKRKDCLINDTATIQNCGSPKICRLRHCGHPHHVLDICYFGLVSPPLRLIQRKCKRTTEQAQETGFCEKWTKDIWALKCNKKFQVRRWLCGWIFLEAHQNVGWVGYLEEGCRLVLQWSHL